MLDEYKTQHPGTEIELISLPWGQAFEKLGTMLQSGQVPDVVEMPDTARLIRQQQYAGRS